VLRLLALARVTLLLLRRLGHVRGPGIGVEVGAAALDLAFASLVSTLVAQVVGSSAS
jgi:hypothetical protein